MKTHKIDCTGDCCVGDDVKFERAIFKGSYRKPKFSHNETIVGTIIRDSYGKDKQQHTFTIQLENGEKLLIKGRNLYRNGTFRKPWTDESARAEIIQLKHERGNVARLNRNERNSSSKAKRRRA